MASGLRRSAKTLRDFRNASSAPAADSSTWNPVTLVRTRYSAGNAPRPLQRLRSKAKSSKRTTGTTGHKASSQRSYYSTLTTRAGPEKGGTGSYAPGYPRSGTRSRRPAETPRAPRRPESSLLRWCSNPASTRTGLLSKTRKAGGGYSISG